MQGGKLLLWIGVGAVVLVAVVGAFFFSKAWITPKEPAPDPFKPELLSWSAATSTAEWEPRDSASSFIFQGRMWTMGGLNGNAEVTGSATVRYWEAPHFNDVWSTADGITWTLMTEHAAWTPRRSMSVVEFNGTLWMFGGWSPISGYASEVWQSIDGVNWNKVATGLPWSPREGQTVEVFQGKIWMIGGVNYDNRRVNNEVWYSENGVDWNEATTTIPWSPRWDHATAVFKGKMYLTAGMDLSLRSFNDVWVSEDGSNWELLQSNPPWVSRQGHAMLVFKDRMWLVGRLNDKETGGPNDIWYSSDGVLWEKTLTDPEWPGREDHWGMVFNNRMYVFGGMNSDWEWENDVWMSSN